MTSSISLAIRCSLVLLISALFVSGCSSSSDSASDVPQMAADPSGSNGDSVTPSDATMDNVNETEAVPAGDTNSGVQTEPTDGSDENAMEGSEEPVVDQEMPDNSNPVVAGGDTLMPVQAALELVPDKTFRITWNTLSNASYYRVLENPDSVSGFSDISGQLDASTSSFDHRVALYARVNAQYLVQSCNDQGCVDSAALTVTGTLQNAIGYFKASNTDGGDNFGVAVSLSADGTTLAVGASGESSAGIGVNADQNDNSIVGSGAVYVFTLNDGLWDQQAYLKASIPGGNTYLGDARFGNSVSLSADGNTLAVAAFRDANAATGINSDQVDNSASYAGAVYVFARRAELWQQQAYIKASNTDRGDSFGRVVSLSANGTTLAVGAPSESGAGIGVDADQNDNSMREAGAVYVFILSDGLWEQQAYVKASNAGQFDTFGNAVSLSADGNTLAVGAAGEDGAATGVNGDQASSGSDNSGAVYVFIRSEERWQQQAYVKASNTDRWDFFGSAVSLNADGNTMAIAAEGEDGAATGVNGDQSSSGSDNSGAVYVFVRSADTWQQQAYVKASNTGEGDLFGSSLSLSADGNTLAVAANGEASLARGINGDQSDNSTNNKAGAAYVFAQRNGLWQQQAYVKASNTGLNESSGTTAVGLSADGNTLAFGVTGESSSATGINGEREDNSTRQAGAVYMY